MSDEARQDRPARALPGPQGGALRNLREAFGGYAGFLDRLHADYGAIAAFAVPTMRICVLFDPELMQEVLVTKRACFEKGPALKRSTFLTNSTILTGDGEPHRRRRKLMKPPFHREALAGYAEIMTEAAATLDRGWRDGQTVDMAAEMQRVTLEIETGTFFGRDAGVGPQVVLDAVEAMRWGMTLVFLPFNGLLRRLPLPRNRQARRAYDRLDRAIFGAIRRAREEPGRRSDLISLLVQAEDAEGAYAGLSDSEVRDECYAVLAVAHAAMANAMTWVFHHLARNPEVLARIEREVDGVLAGRPPAFGDLDSLPYTRAVFDETLRLTPPIYIFGRRAIADCTIGGHEIRAGTTVQLAVQRAQRDARYFPEPERFEPERWLDGSPEPGDSIAYLPFGGGNRLCIGSAFARMAATLVLASVVQRWRVELLSDGPVEVDSLVIYRPRDGLPMRLRARDGRSAAEDAAPGKSADAA